MSAPTIKLHGKNGTCTINGSAFSVSEWDVTGTSALDDSTDTGDLGYMTQTAGLRQATGTLNFYVVGSVLPTIVDGQQIANVILGNSNGGTAVTLFSCAYADVSDVKVTSPVAGVVSYSIDFTSHGQFQYGAMPS